MTRAADVVVVCWGCARKDNDNAQWYAAVKKVFDAYVAFLGRSFGHTPLASLGCVFDDSYEWLRGTWFGEKPADWPLEMVKQHFYSHVSQSQETHGLLESAKYID